LAKRNVVHVQWMIKYVSMSQSRAGDVESFCQRVKWGLLRVAGYVAWIAQSSVVMSEMVEAEDDIGRFGPKLYIHYYYFRRRDVSTPWAIKRETLFQTITLIVLNRFLQILHLWKQE